MPCGSKAALTRRIRPIVSGVSSSPRYAAFAMPMGYQTSLMIYGPGGYQVKDFVKMGIPLDLILAVLALILIPFYWPLVVR